MSDRRGEGVDLGRRVNSRKGGQSTTPFLFRVSGFIYSTVSNQITE